MSYPLKQNSAARPLLFLMIDNTDHLTGKPGLSPAVTISKNGAAFAAPTGAVTELGSGWYQVAGNATDTNTLGVLLLHATATGADPTDAQYEVELNLAGDKVAVTLAAADTTGLPLASDYTSARAAKLDNLDAAVSSRSTYAGGPVASVTGSVGSISGVTFPTNFGSLGIDASGHVTRVTLVDTCTTNTDMRGTDGANTVAPPSQSVVAAAVWDLATSGHTTAGTFGAAMNAAGSAGDPWATTLPGSYAAGQAGYILGTNLDAAVSTRLAAAGYTAPDNAGIGTISTRVLLALPDAAPGGAAGLPVLDINGSVASANLNPNQQWTGLYTTHSTGTIFKGLDTGGIQLAAVQTMYAPAKAGDAMALTSAYDAAKTAAQAGDAMALTTAERASVAAAVWGYVVSGTLTAAQYLRLAGAALFGRRSNAGTNTEQYDDPAAPGTPRIVANADSSGNGTPTLTP